MKKFICAIAMLVAFIPFIGVNAINETTNYYSYKKGQIVNFYPTKADEDAHGSKALETIIVEDKDTSSRFIRVWSMGGVGQEPGNAYASNSALNSFKDSVMEFWAQNSGITTGAVDATENNYFVDFNATVAGSPALDFVTVTDLKTMFATGMEVVDEAAGQYKLNNVDIIDRNGTTVKLYDEFTMLASLNAVTTLESTKNGFYVIDDVNSTARLLIAKFVWNGNTLEGINIAPADATTTNTKYMYLPIMYANKTADCHQGEMCYICGEEYKWATVGSQDASCKAVPSAKTVEDCAPEVCYQCKDTEDETKFNFFLAKKGKAEYSECEIVDKTKCNTKTGVESHVLEFAIVAALCAIALIVVKRKDLFKTI